VQTRAELDGSQNDALPLFVRSLQFAIRIVRPTSGRLNVVASTSPRMDLFSLNTEAKHTWKL
jgi:hypothetical protein